MKILIISTEFLPYLGGVASHTYYLSKGLQKIGHSVTILTRKYKNKTFEQIEIDRKLDEKGISCLRLNFTKKIFAIFWRKQIRKFLKNNSFDLCVINNDGAQIVMSHHSITPLLNNYLVVVHGKSIKKFINNSNFLMRFFYNNNNILKLFKKSTKITAVSSSIKKWIKDSFSLENIDVINNCIDADTFYYEKNFEKNAVQMKKKYGIYKDDKILMSASRLSKNKGQETLINIFNNILKENKNVTLILCGDGNYKKKLEKQVTQLGIKEKVIFTGRLDHSELRDCYQLSDVFILLSIHESFGLVFLEANACKTPVVGSNIEGIPDAIENGVSGFLVNPLDSDECEMKILSLIIDKKMNKKMGEQGFMRVQEDFLEEIIANNFIKSSEGK